ncbi:MAG: biotin carboxylase N-terminal domain-containing protein, partial [Victivallaceae bacterium]
MNQHTILFNKILIANRGEIAIRVMRAAKALGIRTVAVYAEVDRDSWHVAFADEAYCLGEQELADTYLNVDKIIAIARETGADAIHPGYGFLSENPALVQSCENSGITFIGPDTRAIKLMGNKIESREFVKKLNVPTTQGVTGDTETLIRLAADIPLPILVKAAAGGGGKGMRIVRDLKELPEIIEATQREAKTYFGDGTVFVEKYVEEPRHIEIQVMGDKHGNTVHLFERECSIQRRYQKIIEESPSPTLTPEVRQKMGEAAVKITRAINYSNAGTIEFLVDK